MTNTFLYGEYKEKAGENISYDMTVKYYLNEQIESGVTRYGITVEKETKEKAETKSVNCIFYERGEAEDFLRVLMRNKVTPLTLSEVTEEYFAKKIRII